MVAEFPFHRPRVIICAVTASPTPRLQLKIKAEDKNKNEITLLWGDKDSQLLNVYECKERAICKV